MGAPQIKRHRRSAADRAFHDYGAARLVGKPVDLRQSKASALPERFRAEKRLENSRQDVRRNADTGIAHRECNEISLELFHLVALLEGNVLR